MVVVGIIICCRLDEYKYLKNGPYLPLFLEADVIFKA